MRTLRAMLAVVCAIPGIAGIASSEPRKVYDDQGRLVLEVREDGSIVSRSYDEEGREVKRDLPDGSKVETPPAPSESGDARE